MIDPELQPLKVTIEFSYDAELYEGDPTDAYEIARLETLALEGAFDSAISSVIGNPKFFRVRIQPD